MDKKDWEYEEIFTDVLPCSYDASEDTKETKLIQECAYDRVDHPAHYTKHPSGIECIQITEHMNFNLGNAVKYIWRSGLKNAEDKGVEDLRKAKFYIEREINRLK